MHALSRRNLLKGSLASGLTAATTACQHGNPSNSTEPYTVNLICNGMLAYYCEVYKKEDAFRISFRRLETAFMWLSSAVSVEIPSMRANTAWSFQGI